MGTKATKYRGLEFGEALLEERGGKKAFKTRGDIMSTPPTPKELHRIYSSGFRGIRPESINSKAKAKWKKFRAASPRLYDIFPWAKNLGKGKLNAPWLGAVAMIKGWGGLYAQVQGDCTVHGTEHASEIDYCMDCLYGETKFMGPLAFENIYRSRGFNGDGWSCEAPCMYVGPQGSGGFLHRIKYVSPDGKETVDLTDYNSSWQSKGGSGVPKWLEEISRLNKAKYIIPIENREEYRDAHALGFGINFCSGQAWRSSTDEFGVAGASGSWSHALCHPGNNDTEWAYLKYKMMLGMIQNSWGNWNTINGKPPGHPDMSTGSWYSLESAIMRLMDGDQFAVCGVWGWDRTSWEGFDISDLVKHMRNSTQQDYYKVRSEKLVRLTEKAYDIGVEKLTREEAMAV